MFKSKTPAIAILVLLAIAAAFGIGLLLVPAQSRDTAFWISLSIISLSEVLLGACLVNLTTSRADRAEPFKLVYLVILAAYLAFAIAMAFALMNVNASAQTYIWIAHICAALLLAALFIYTAIARNHKNTADAELAHARLPKTDFQSTIAVITDLARDNNATPAHLEKLARLADNARYAAESLPGAAQADEAVRRALDNLKATIPANDTPALDATLRTAAQTFAQRETTIKNLRA